MVTKKRKKQIKNISLTLGVLFLLGLVFFFTTSQAIVSGGSYSTYSSKFYTLNSAGLVLDTRGDTVPVDFGVGFGDRGYATAILTDNDRNFVQGIFGSGKVLDDKCYVTTRIISARTNDIKAIQIEGEAVYSQIDNEGSRFLCKLEVVDYFNDPFYAGNQKYTGSIITWKFIDPPVEEIVEAVEEGVEDTVEDSTETTSVTETVEETIEETVEDIKTNNQIIFPIIFGIVIVVVLYFIFRPRKKK